MTRTWQKRPHSVRAVLARSLATVTAAALAQLACSEPAPPAPNLVLITLDTLRADRLGSYGHAPARTPVLDGIAAGGVRFQDAVSQATTTPPSHASILTGLNPARHGLRKLHGQRLPEANETLAEILRARGYTTAAFVSDLPLGSRTGLDQGFDLYDELDEQIPAGAGEAGDTNARVFRWLDDAPEAPVFLWVHYFDPHHPYYPPTDYRDAVGLGDADWAQKVLPRNTNRKRPDGRTLKTPAPKVTENMSRLYDAEVAYTDAAVGALLARLREEGLLDDAVVAFVADHGEQLGEGGYYFGHWDVLEETARVPMVISHSDGRHAGAVVEQLVATIDLLPTLLAWLGVDASLDFDGRDLTPLARGEALPERPVYTEQFEYFPVRAMRGRDWMLRQAAAPRARVEDAEALLQPRTRARSNRASPRDVVAAEDAKQALSQALSEAAHPEERHETEWIEVPGAVRAQLRALGYTDEARGPDR